MYFITFEFPNKTFDWQHSAVKDISCSVTQTSDYLHLKETSIETSDHSIMADKMNITESCFGLKTIKFQPTTSVIITALGVSIFNSIFSFIAIFSNGLMLYILSSKSALHSPSNLLLGSLCVTDFIVGLVVQPLNIVSRLFEVHSIHLCTVKLIYAYFAFLCSGASFLNIALISIDRWYAVCHPFQYEKSVTTKKYAVLISIMWLCWSTMTLLPFINVMDAKHYNILLTVSAVFAAIIIIICYCCIYKVIKHHNRVISVTHSLGTMTNDTKVKRTKEHRRSNTMAIIILVLFLCYTPNTVCSLLETFIGSSLSLAYVAWHWTGLLVFFNSSCNPVLYCIRNRDIRQAVYRELNRRFGLCKSKMNVVAMC